MGQSYEQRRASVEEALREQHVSPEKGRSLAEVAGAVLDALDSGKERIR